MIHYIVFGMFQSLKASVNSSVRGNNAARLTNLRVFGRFILCFLDVLKV